MKRPMYIIIKQSIKKVLLLSLILTMFSSFNLSADTGPKPSVTVFTDINEKCYITLLSKDKEYANWHVGKKEYKSDHFMVEDEEEHKREIDKFFSYEDADGYYNIGNYKVLF